MPVSRGQKYQRYMLVHLSRPPSLLTTLNSSPEQPRQIPLADAVEVSTPAT